MTVSLGMPAAHPAVPDRAESKRRLRELLAQRPELAERVRALRDMGRRVRGCEIHLTTACNIRCKGCWYFEGGFDAQVPETNDIGLIREFAAKLAARGYTQASLIGGEPTIVLDRVRPFVEHLPYLIISTNGLRRLPMDGFENVAVAVSLFGGGPLDDELRAHRPNGSSFAGLFQKALGHYRDDPRVTFVYALSARGLEYVEPTVKLIRDNGNQVNFNYYSEHGSDDPLQAEHEQRVLAEALRVKARYPETVVSHESMIRALITGRSHWGAFGYEVCPSISVELPQHAARLGNGNPALDGFAVYGADFETLQFCCTSGNCADCRDSQAVYSWLLVSMNHYLDSPEQLTEWVEIAESYWRQWYWAQRRSDNFARIH
ncbi:radical SAM protein [Nocardia sp. CDC159]|uniref:Radical SAM protein n=1 Tax=Nocardia pulmonis TaxID=2951408 RepID=A0A9X2E4T1_9NOCA|nr:MULTISPECIES: radical SAM protein [Nocardia]MCM6774312.1 radical SAM protein [Nocardia pulmonis]MCM6787622.1 radical SAM protein [Nocardia sp. CDC159]